MACRHRRVAPGAQSETKVFHGPAGYATARLQVPFGSEVRSAPLALGRADQNEEEMWAFSGTEAPNAAALGTNDNLVKCSKSSVIARLDRAIQ
jgi:hypothetical protein